MARPTLRRVDHLLERAALREGESVLDLGTGTGAVAVRAAEAVGELGSVTAVDLSPEMLSLAQKRAAEAGANNIEVREGRAEEIPVGVGPGALADPSPFLTELADAGIAAEVDTEVIEFEFATFEEAWDVLGGVTTANLDDDRRAQAKHAVQDAMWPDPSSQRAFLNRTQFIVFTRR